ncbi:MAG: hypothetical protein DRQ88_10345 [Epsilonproteobacteria bacterium]|nr:MAG: hypothetical protein DRQ88_10345 [Campylobacterota bacterium]RLA65374.1 MAG: hypothetical protein DRQ89_01245 [Campylobacterota bacterium]
MAKLLVLIFLLSNAAYAIELPDSFTDQRSFDEARAVVERSKVEREQFENRGPEREIASEEEFDPEFKKDFDEMMEDVD